MVRQCVSGSVREEIGKGGIPRVLQANGDGDPRAMDLDTYVSTRVFKTVPWSDV